MRSLHWLALVAHLVTGFLLSVSIGAGCSKEREGSVCKSIDDCQGGWTCVEEKCRRLCNSDVECGSPCDHGQIGEVCDGGACLPGCREAPPEITSIDGNGSLNTNGSPISMAAR
ncbi:hypothetical protein ACFL6C_11985 [Myxococcota bacterium]